MRWQAATALAAAAFAAGDFAAAALTASGANPILDPEAAMAAIPAALRAGRVILRGGASPVRRDRLRVRARSSPGPARWGSKGARRDGEEHGSSRWATRKDIAPFGDPKDPDNNIILTDNARIRLVSRRFDLSTDTNDNVLVVGGPGTGKTRYYVKPNLLQANASFFVTDPKGTLIREMGGALAELGYEIRAFDTIDFSRSMRFNPIAYIRDEAGVIRFARGIVANTEGDADHKGDPYWEKAERLVYTALTAYLVMHCEPADRNLDGLLTLLSLADARDDPGYMSPLDMVFRELETGERYVRRGGASAERRRVAARLRRGGRRVGVGQGPRARAARRLRARELPRVPRRRRRHHEVDALELQRPPEAAVHPRRARPHLQRRARPGPHGRRGREGRALRVHERHRLDLRLPVHPAHGHGRKRALRRGARGARRLAAHDGALRLRRVRQHRAHSRLRADHRRHPQPEHRGLDDRPVALAVEGDLRRQQRRDHRERLRHAALPGRQGERDQRGDQQDGRQADGGERDAGATRGAPAGPGP